MCNHPKDHGQDIGQLFAYLKIHVVAAVLKVLATDSNHQRNGQKNHANVA